MQYLSIRNWGSYQHYKHRNPPWIKLHMQLSTDYEFLKLDDVDKLHLLLSLLLAARYNNAIPNDPQFLQQTLCLSEPFRINRLVDAGWLVIADCKHAASTSLADAIPKCSTETETETEAETEKTVSRAFKKPSRDELQQYANDRGFVHFDPDAFLDHYEANGWRVGRNPMKSWQHTASKWERENAKRHNETNRKSNRGSNETAAERFSRRLGIA